MEIKKNNDYEIVIEDMTMNGEGVGRINGYALFVKDAITGDKIIARAVKLKKNYGYGRLMEIIEPSPYRVASPCPVSRACGGCTLMAMDYKKQLEFKNSIIKNNLYKIGGIKDIELPPVLGMDNPYRYRNKAQFPVGTDKNGNIIMGFYAGRTHSIIPTDDCLIGTKDNAGILAKIKEYMLKYKVEAYNEESHTGLVRHILIRSGFTTGQIMVCIVINGESLPGESELVKMLQTVSLCNDGKIASIMTNINRDRTNVIMGRECRLLFGTPYIEDYIGNIKYRISPLSFYQVNPVQTKVLYEKALEFAALTGKETVWDLYCGIGTISLFLAGKAKMVYGVEIVPEAIEDAIENARLNGIENARFYVGKAEEVLPEKYEKESIKADVIVVDPPRKGCDETLLKTMVDMQPDRIVYVSCDSATLARDLKYLTANGYEVKRVQGVDQFCHSGHVETVCLLSKLHEAKYHVNVKLDMDEMDLTSAGSKATYEEIKAYVAEHNDGMKVSSLNIAQVKRKCGIELGENFNLPKSGDSRQPQCTKEKEEAIMEALQIVENHDLI